MRCLLQDFLNAREEGLGWRSITPIRWCPPGVGTHKVNVDGVIFADLGFVGMGVVARDHEGLVLAAVSKKIRGSFEALEVEAMAMRFATGFAKDLGFRSVIFEGDNLEVINALTSYDALFTAVGLVIEDVYYEAKTSFDVFQFSHIGRTGNEVAHGLARYARNVLDVEIWLDETPVCVRDQVFADLVHGFS